MQKYLPSKIFIAVTASALFIVGGGYFVFFRTYMPQKNIVAQKTVERNEQASLFASKDTDDDGLKDWEEVLWHTNPEKADTDRDGTADNDEILAKRDPTKAGLPAEASAEAGPGDEIDRQLSKIDAPGASMGEGKQEEQSDTLTEQLARDFGETYLKRKFGTGAIDKDYLSKLLFSGVADTLVRASNQQATQYFFANDFRIIDDGAASSIRDYLNNLADIISQDAATPNAGEVELAIEAIMKEDFSQFETLLTYRDAYYQTVDRMKDLPVPVTMANIHVDMANSFWRLGVSAEQISKFEKDPVGAIAAFDTHLEERFRSVEPLKRIVNEIKKRHLVFREDEKGAVFNKYLSML